MAQFLIVLKQVFTLFLMIGVGFLLGKSKRIDASGTKAITFLMVNIALPCSIVKAFLLKNEDGFLRSIAFTAAAAVIMALILALLSLALFRKEPAERRPVLQIGSIYSNSVFMGLALVQAVLGPEAVIYSTILFIVELIFLLLQMELTMPQGRPSLWKVLRNPGVIAFAAGLLLLLLGLPLPAPVESTMTSLGGMNAPLAMIILGLQISRSDLRAVFNQGILYRAAAYKLLLAPALAAALLLPFRLPRTALCAIVICKATCQPAILSAYVAERGRDAVCASQLVALTSILQLATLPVIAAAIQMAR